MPNNPPVKQPHRYVAYVDILGFKEIIRTMENDFEQNAAVFETLRGVFDRIEGDKAVANVVSHMSADQTTYASFSDSLSISAADNYGGLVSILTRLLLLTMDLMRRGIFIRGAITKGVLYHKGPVLFGGGLIRAVELESKLARYPRIIIESTVVGDANSWFLGTAIDQWWRDIWFMDRDGVAVLAPFFPLYGSKDGASGEAFAGEHLAEVANHIKQHLLDLPVDDERYAKMYWLKNTVNDRIIYWRQRGILTHCIDI